MEILIFTEGGREQGLGHIVRCSAMCEAIIAEGVEPHIYVNTQDNLDVFFGGYRHEVKDWGNNYQDILDKLTGCEVAIVDSYMAGMDFYEKLSTSVKAPVYIDDTRRLEYPRGIIVNFSLYATELYKDRGPEHYYMLGNRYIPLREDFVKAVQKIQKKRESLKRVFISFGGTDIRGFSARTLELLGRREYRGIEKRIMIGKCASLSRSIEKYVDDNTEILYDPSPEVIGEVMAASDMAITAAGMTLYELAYCGVPTIAVAIADNQLRGLKEFVRAGFIGDFLRWDDTDIMGKLKSQIDSRVHGCSKLKEIAQIGRNIVDGKGSRRIVRGILEQASRL